MLFEIFESKLSLTKVYKTILCKMITTEVGVGGDSQLSIKALHPPLLDVIIFRKF